jgi:RNA polymerase sigma-70 factor, ECF subfamily
VDDDLKQMEDCDLMALVKRGDFSAFDELYSRYSPRIRRFLFSLSWDQESAEDCLQEVFLRLYRARDRYEPTGKFSTYILQIAKNYYISQCRKRRAGCGEVPLTQESKDGARPFENIRANPRIEPEVHLIDEYRRFRIRRAIRALPESQRLVFVMSHIEDMKLSEIAEVLGIPIGTVKSRMFAAVRSLRRALEEEHDEL